MYALVLAGARGSPPLCRCDLRGNCHPPIATNQLLPTICHQPIATNQLPLTNCHQPFATNHFSPTNCHQPVVVNQLPPTINCHPPIATNQLLPTNCHQLNRHQPSYQAILTNQLSSTSCHQPIATHQLPPTNFHQPIAICHQPTATNQSSSTNHQLSAPVSGEVVNMWGYPVLYFSGSGFSFWLSTFPFLPYPPSCFQIRFLTLRFHCRPLCAVVGLDTHEYF